jgi:sarcosine oxidase delta subunit
MYRKEMEKEFVYHGNDHRERKKKTKKKRKKEKTVYLFFL